MSKELVISSSRHETRLAILEDDQLVEVYFQRSNEYSLAGSIHKGRVTRVLPGMQSAFVDLGLERDTFLYVSDFFEENEDYDRLPGGKEERVKEERPREGRNDFTRKDGRQEQRFEPPAAVAKPAENPPETEEITAPAASRNIADSVEEPEAREQAQPREQRSGEQRPGGEQRPSDPRDRNGRRSRRRRRGGRGFPDSKYASDLPVEGEKEPREETAPEASPHHEEPENNREVILLPGESLAKYSRPAENSSTEDASPRHQLQNRQESHVDHNPPELPADEPATASAFPESSYLTPAPVMHEAGAAPVSSEENAVPTAPVKQVEAASRASISTEAPPPQDEPEKTGELEESIAETGVASVSEIPENVQPSSEEEEDGGEPRNEPGDLELAMEEAMAASEDEAEALAAEAPAENEGGSAPLSASVREQGQRYQHRGPGGPRGMRRRRRGGSDRPESPRPERSEGAPAASPAPEERRDRNVARPDKPALPSISELLKEGQEIIVQIAKEPLGQKGARITSHIALPGRYVVYMPSLDHLGVSRKIESDDERLRLKRILQNNITGITGGFIVRTAGEGRTEAEIAADMSFLYNLWLDMRQKAEKKPAPVLLHHDLDIVQRTLRDQLTDSFKTVWVDNEEVYESILRFVQRFQPALVGRIKLYTRDAPIFDAFNITSELEKALRPKVWLKSGGYIVINQTEALVAIDINTGKYVGKSNRLEDTIVKTNTEAIREIVRQIRLRDLGGIIVVDFIDMDERKNRQKVMQALEEAMRADRAPYKILQFNDFGLVAITRKRVKQSLERTLCAPCPTCEGAGYVKSPQTVVGEILQEAQKIKGVVSGKDVMLRANPEVAKLLKSNNNHYLEEIEDILRRPVLVTGDPALHPDKFDLA